MFVQPESYQPHSIPPNWGGHPATGAQNSFRHYIGIQTKLWPSKSEKWNTRDQWSCGALWKNSAYTYNGKVL